jgi:hypothetical protein
MTSLLLSPLSFTNIIQFFIITVLAQQPWGQLQREQEQKKKINNTK